MKATCKKWVGSLNELVQHCSLQNCAYQVCQAIVLDPEATLLIYKPAHQICQQIVLALNTTLLSTKLHIKFVSKLCWLPYSQLLYYFMLLYTSFIHITLYFLQDIVPLHENFWWQSGRCLAILELVYPKYLFFSKEMHLTQVTIKSLMTVRWWVALIISVMYSQHRLALTFFSKSAVSTVHKYKNRNSN